MNDNGIEILARGVCVKDGMILLCRTKGDSNTYLPGGHVEFGEAATAALSREILEEMGVRSVAGRFIGAVEHTFIQRGDSHCEVNLVFEMSCDDLSVDVAPLSREDYIEFCWVKMDDLLEAQLEPAALIDVLEDWLGSVGNQWASNY